VIGRFPANRSRVGWATLFCPPFTDKPVGKTACPPYGYYPLDWAGTSALCDWAFPGEP